MVDVICDTSFLIHLATRNIKNLDSIYSEIGNIEFVVPLVVLNELEQLTKNQLETWGVKYHKLFMGKPSGDLYVDDKGVKDEHFFGN